MSEIFESSTAFARFWITFVVFVAVDVVTLVLWLCNSIAKKINHKIYVCSNCCELVMYGIWCDYERIGRTCTSNSILFWSRSVFKHRLTTFAVGRVALVSIVAIDVIAQISFR